MNICRERRRQILTHTEEQPESDLARKYIEEW
jgi:hypothetical protein